MNGFGYYLADTASSSSPFLNAPIRHGRVRYGTHPLSCSLLIVYTSDCRAVPCFVFQIGTLLRQSAPLNTRPREWSKPSYLLDLRWPHGVRAGSWPALCDVVVTFGIWADATVPNGAMGRSSEQR
jgi:hypothetical protein